MEKIAYIVPDCVLKLSLDPLKIKNIIQNIKPLLEHKCKYFKKVLKYTKTNYTTLIKENTSVTANLLN